MDAPGFLRQFRDAGPGESFFVQSLGGDGNDAFVSVGLSALERPIYLQRELPTARLRI
jgi:hypothetical protein